MNKVVEKTPDDATNASVGAVGAEEPANATDTPKQPIMNKAAEKHQRMQRTHQSRVEKQEQPERDQPIN